MVRTHSPCVLTNNKEGEHGVDSHMILGDSDKVLVIIKHHSQEDCKVAAKYPWVSSLLLGLVFVV